MMMSTTKSQLCWLLACIILGCLSSEAWGFLSASKRPTAALLSKKKSFVIAQDDHSGTKRATAQQRKATSSSSAEWSSSIPHRSRRTQHKDAVIIGGGLAGLSAALYLSQIDPDRHITILDKERHESESKKKTTVGSFAAAGMLAPQSERLPKGHLLDICLASRRMYPEFVDLVESLARESGEEGAPFLLEDTNSDNANSEPWSVGYLASGGFLAPAFAGDSVATWAPPDESGGASWLDETQVRELEPNLHPDVVGGWWFPEDASVDARRLTCSLYAACAATGVQFLCGDNYEVTSLDLTEGECRGLWLKNGSYFKTKSVLVANGAWMRNLLPVPIEPHKGQSLSLKMPSDRPPILRRVLFAQDSYIVPKVDGHIVIGATVEAGSYDGNVTPAGLLHVLTHALQLVPGLQDLPVVETWAGLRPTTPDKGPILGKSPWKNLFLAGGYWRNGVLLAPKTAQLLACLMSDVELSKEDAELLQAFSWDRFTAPGGGAALAANARYAASMHPIHSRRSGAGVAASVGTELGSYSTAKSAKEERQRDRNSLWGDDAGISDSFERAASLGRQDAATFTFDGSEKVNLSSEPLWDILPETESADVSSDQQPASSSTADMSSVYETIKANKEKKQMSLPEQVNIEERPDPGFRINHIDSETGESREVPPYTSPGAFLQSIGKLFGNGFQNPPKNVKPSAGSSSSSTEAAPTSAPTESSTAEYSEKTYDGYQDIQQANASPSREDELKAMKAARMKNRLGQAIDETAFGDGIEEQIGQEDDRNNEKDMTSVYATIQKNKAKQNMTLPDSNSTDERPDPGFRIYHLDSETGESREVPPYTPQGDFLLQIADEKRQSQQKTTTRKPANGRKQPLTAAKQPSGGINGEAKSSSSNDYSEKTYDGYQDIENANGNKGNRAAELKAMKKARQRNRVGQTGIDESKLK